MNLAYLLSGVIYSFTLLIVFLFWKEVSATSAVSQNSGWLKRLSPVFILWVITAFALSISPLFRTPWQSSANTTFLLPLIIFTPVLVTVLLLRVPNYRQLVDTVRPHHIVLIHTLRAVIGSSFLGLYALGYLPRGFALAAGFGDIAIGLSAIPVALLLQRKAKYALTLAAFWNVLGLLDLLNALRLGRELVSFYITTQTPSLNGLVPLLGVPLYIIWHIYSLRFLWSEAKARATLVSSPSL